MNRLKDLRLKTGLNMLQVSKALDIPYTTYVNYEKGTREPNSEMLIKLASFFGVSIDYLIGRTDNLILNTKNSHDKIFTTDETSSQEFKEYGLSPIKTKKFPMLGNIACGEPIFANEEHETYIEASDDIKADFCVTAKGDSMINARIFNGDIVFIKKQDYIDNGEIAAVLIDDEVTLKRVYHYNNRLELRPENPTYKVLNYEGEELNHIRIIGKAVVFQSNVQ